MCNNMAFFLLAKSCRTVSNLHSYRRQKDTDCNVTFLICLYFRRSSTVSDSCWAGICCPGKKYLDLFGGLDVKTWYVSHVIWVCISTLSLCYMQEVWEEWFLLPFAPVHNKQHLILFWSSSLSHLMISPG